MSGILEQHGPAYVKVGQFLALHPELTASVPRDALLWLVDAAPAIAFERVQEILAADLGGDAATAFAAIEPVPLSAGVLAQTHRAVLQDGTAVTVKVQRSGARAAIVRELGRGGKPARALEQAGIELAIAPRELVARFDAWLQRRLDAAAELANMAELGHAALTSADVRVAEPYPQLSSARIVTATDVGGVAFTTLRRAHSAGDRRVRSAGARGGVDTGVLAESLLLVVLTQLLCERRFQVDVLPDNLRALPGGAITFADYSLCEPTSDMWRERDLRLLTAIYDDNVQGAFGVLRRLFENPDETSLGRFRDELARAAASRDDRSAQLREPPAAGTSTRESAIADTLVCVLRLAARHGLRLAEGEHARLRTLATAETVAAELAGGDAASRAGRDLLGAVRRGRVVRRFEREDLDALGSDLLALLRESPQQCQQVLRELGDGSFELPVTVSELPATRDARRRRARLVATAVLSAAVAGLLAGGRPEDVGLTVPLLLALTCVYATVAVGWWRLR